jgi:hypothetical protein
MQLGGFDVYFTVTIPNNSAIEVSCIPGSGASITELSATIARRSDGRLLVSGSDTRQTTAYLWDARSVSRWRVLGHGQFISVYADGHCVHTFAFEKFNYGLHQIVQISASWNASLTDVRKTELYDWREAIWIDLESTAMNALGGVIQERPVEYLPASDGSIRFFYTPETRPTASIPAVLISQHEISWQKSPGACSDAIVQWADVGTLVDEDSARDLGFVTVFYRMSNLDYGAMEAAAIQQRRARQSRTQHNIRIRFYPLLEEGDRVNIEYTLPGTNTPISESMIIESIRGDFSPGRGQMILSGRSAFDDYLPYPRGGA